MPVPRQALRLRDLELELPLLLLHFRISESARATQVLAELERGQ